MTFELRKKEGEEERVMDVSKVEEWGCERMVGLAGWICGGV